MYSGAELEALNKKYDTRFREALRAFSKYKRGLSILTPGKAYGKLTLLQEPKKRVKGINHYPCLCRCGQKAYLQTYEILARKHLDEGCAFENCHDTSLLGKRWLNVDLVIKLQWAYYLYTNPFDVDPKWGGCLVPGDNLINERKALVKFHRYIKPLVKHKKGKIWVRKKEQVLPLIEDNIVLSHTRPLYMFKIPWQYMSTGEEFLSVEDVAAKMCTPVSRVMSERAKKFFSFDAYCALLSSSI